MLPPVLRISGGVFPIGTRDVQFCEMLQPVRAASRNTSLCQSVPARPDGIQMNGIISERVGRQDDDELRAHIDLAFYLDISPMLFDDAVAYRQPQTGAAP